MFSFAEHKKSVDLQPYIRHLCDITTPNLAIVTAFDGRSENRYNRTIPTLLSPWQDDRPLVDECIIGLTSDMADRGVRLVLNQPFPADTVIVGYWISSDTMPEPWFFLGNIRRNQAIGGEFWAVGIELTEFANTNYNETLAVLKPLAAKLLAPVEVATA